MIGLAWNCWGTGHISTIRHLWGLVRSHRPQFLFLAEIKMSDSEKIHKLVKFVGFSNFEIVPSCGRGTAFIMEF